MPLLYIRTLKQITRLKKVHLKLNDEFGNYFVLISQKLGIPFQIKLSEIILLKHYTSGLIIF